MSDEFQQLFKHLTEERINGLEFLSGLGMINSDFRRELLELLQLRVQTGNLKWASMLIEAMRRHPSREFTPILCQLLDQRSDNNLLEGIVETLDEIADERSIPTLIRALEYYVPGDGGLNFNKKIIYALSRIGTPEAIEGIQLAFKIKEPEIRQAAGHELAKFL